MVDDNLNLDGDESGRGVWVGMNFIPYEEIGSYVGFHSHPPRIRMG